MSAQSGNSWQIVFALQEACDPLFDEFMENFFAASACDYTDDGKVRYIGYSSAPVDEPRMAQAAAAFGLALPPGLAERIRPRRKLADQKRHPLSAARHR